MKKLPLIWAHRGANVKAPENTLMAFQKAIDDGADGIELDVQLTNDDVMVICHDEKVDRTSNGKGWVKDYNFDEIRQLNFNQNFPELENMQIPTLEEVIQLIYPTSLTIDIELKTSIIFYPQLEEKVIDLVKKYHMEERVNYSSFNHYTCRHILELNPDAEVGFLYCDGPIDFPIYAKKYGAKAINPAYYNLALSNTIQQAKDLGLHIYVWEVDEEEYVLDCINKEVTAIITNDPARLRRYYATL